MSVVLLTFHGGSTQTSINNVGVYELGNGGGRPGDPFYALGPAVRRNFGALPALRELRGLASHPEDGTLLVANAYRSFNQVLQFSETSTPHMFEFTGIYASDGLNHPFDVAFGFDNALYVSNQDAEDGKHAVITYYTAAGAKGVEFPAKAKFATLRGLAFDGTYLYVADAGAKGDGMLYGFSSDGHLHRSHPLKQPVHVLYDGTRYVYIGDESEDCVYVYDTTTDAAPTPLIKKGSGLDHAAGLAFIAATSSSATLLVASRKSSEVLAYPITFDPTPGWDGTRNTFLQGLTDFPEFVFVRP
jgi:hypothetical protein